MFKNSLEYYKLLFQNYFMFYIIEIGRNGKKLRNINSNR